MPWLVPSYYAMEAFVRVRDADRDARKRGGRVDLDPIHRCSDGRPADPDTIPRRFAMETARKTLPDAFTVEGSYFVVSPALRAVLAAHDMGANQLFDIALLTEKGEAFGAGGYAILNVTELKDTLVPEKTQGDWFDDVRLGRVFNIRTIGEPDPITLTPEAEAGVDLWRERGEGRRGLFMSDRLAAATKRAKIRWLNPWRCAVGEREG